MNWPFLIYIVILLVSVAISVVLAAVAWQHRATPGAKPFAALMVAVGSWSLLYALGLISHNTTLQHVWFDAMYLGVVLAPAAWITFALEYTGHTRWLTRRSLLLFTVMPLTTLALIWTNHSHELFRSSFTQSANGWPITFQAVMGPAFWLHTAYSYLLLLSGAVLLIQAVVRSSQLYRRQGLSLIVALLIPWLGNAAYLSSNQTLPTLDLTPMLFTLTGIVLSWGLFRFRLLDIVPVARASLVENMRDGVIVLDMQQRIVDINPAACTIIGHTARQAIGQPAQQVLANYPALLQYTRNDVTRSSGLVLRKAETGQSFSVLVTPLNKPNKRRRGRLIVLHDITELARTAEELLYAKDAAEAANRAKSAFMRNMSHELRTPLTAIMGYNDLIRHELQSLELTSVMADTDRIRAASDSLLNLISNLLNLAHIEAGGMVVQAESFHVADLREEIIATAQPLVAQQHNTLELAGTEEPGIMFSDKGKLRQILLSLLSNAAKFTTDGAIVLAIHRQMIEGTDWMTFRVTDTGVGIAPDHIPHLFEAFRSGEATVTQFRGGTGLGLAVSRHFCNILGGEITVESQLGSGSSFTVHLPATVSDYTIHMQDDVGKSPNASTEY